MKSKQILFFATSDDIKSIILSIESTHQIKYYEMGLFENKSSSSYNSISEIKNFGIDIAGDWNKSLRFMALPMNSSIKIREVPQKNGNLRYALDPIENQMSICFQFGGIYQEGVLIAGSCFTVNSNIFAMQIFKDFSSKLKKNFKKIGSFYVGENAAEKLKQGWRLVTNESSPKEYDLTYLK